MIGRLLYPVLIWISVASSFAQSEMVSRIYQLYPVFFKQIPDKDLKPTVIDCAGVQVQAYDIRGWCESLGIKFPQGSKATYIAELGAVIILNTQESIDIADSLLEGGCCGLPLWPLKSQLTFVSFRADAIDPVKGTLTYNELRESAGESWTVVSSLEITSKANVISSWFAAQPNSKPTKNEDKPSNGLLAVAKGKMKIDPAISAWAFDAEVSYQLHGKNKQQEPIDFSYEGKTFVEMDQPQVLQLMHGEATSYALVLRVTWPLPGGEMGAQDLSSDPGQKSDSVKRVD